MRPVVFIMTATVMYSLGHGLYTLPGWLRSPAVEHRSLAGVLSLSCARLAADGQGHSQDFISTEAKGLTGGLGAEPPAGSRSRAPGQGARG